MLRTLTVKTRQQVEFIDVTKAVQDEITAANVTRGACIVYVPHTTAGLSINENADPDVIRDIKDALEKAAPSSGCYLHQEGNAHAHIKSSLLGCSVCLIIEGGRLVLGTWQGLFFCEFDGPRQRRILLQILKDDGTG
jgi:secondary thiamine-phosphate synthase enzyme